MQRVNSLSTGYSLIEVMVTMTLFVLIIYLLIANVSFLNRSIVRSEADKLCMICRYLQRCAMAANKKQVLIFNEATQEYNFNGVVYTLPSKVKFGFLAGIKGPPSSPKKLISKPITFKSNTIVFYPDGIISSGAVYLTDYDRQYLYSISSSVAQVSYIRKYTYNSKWILIS